MTRLYHFFVLTFLFILVSSPAQASGIPSFIGDIFFALILTFAAAIIGQRYAPVKAGYRRFLVFCAGLAGGFCTYMLLLRLGIEHQPALQSLFSPACFLGALGFVWLSGRVLHAEKPPSKIAANVMACYIVITCLAVYTPTADEKRYDGYRQVAANDCSHALQHASKQYPRSALALGQCYMHGNSDAKVPVDRAKALEWHIVSADSGYTLAQIRLGSIYKDAGEYKEAEKWFKRGANQGENGCQSMLIELYLDHPDSANWEEAYFWLYAAYGKHRVEGNSYFRQKLAVIVPHLTPEQIAAQDRRVAEWKPVAEPQPPYDETTNYYKEITDFTPPQQPQESQSPTLFEAAEFNDTAAIDRLLARGVEVNMKDSNGATPLVYAVKNYESTAAVTELLEKGADVNIVDSLKMTPLHWAASEGAAENIPALLDHGAKLEAGDDRGRTPLMYAVESGYTNAVKALLDRGANPAAVTVFSEDVRSFTHGQNYPDITALLDAAEAKKK